MAIKIRLQQSKFKDANNGGKWHARTVNTGDVLTSDLANEIQATTTFTVVRWKDSSPSLST